LLLFVVFWVEYSGFYLSW